ncbi:hypothetical protein LNK82_00015 [Saccharothrix sp. NEAU-S10]|nr:hypothetical protein [Saccharothrix luteola]
MTSTHRENATRHRATALVSARPVPAAVAMTRALDVFGAPDAEVAVRVPVSLHTPGAAAQGLVAGFYSRRATPITSTLERVLSQARRELFPRLLPSQAPTARPFTPDGARRDLLGAEQTRPRHDRGAAIPTVFWPWWTLCVATHWCRHRLTRTAFACLTPASGTALSIPRALDRLQPEASCGHVSWVLRHLLEEPAWNGLCTALTRLAAHLDEHGSPIDYDRRRALDYTGLLHEQRWSLLLDRTELRHTPALLRVVRGVLFETLSGQPASHAPAHFAPATTEQRDAISDFPAVLTTRLTGELRAVAAEFLAAQGIDEPVTWQPPTELADGLDLPGPSPDALAAGPLHELLAARLPLQRAATHAGLPLDAARFLLAHQPPEITGGPHPEPDLAAQLPAELLRDLYVHRGLSISELAARYQVNRRRIRTLAAELNVQSVTILRWCPKYDLPVRAVGGNGHRSALYDTNQAPPGLRPR